MPETEGIVPATAPEGTSDAPTGTDTPAETALTRTEVAELIAAAKQEVQASLKNDLDAAYKAARRSESKGDVANAKIAKLESQLEAVATRGMDEGEARLWKAERAVERANETSTQVNAQQEYEAAQRTFAEKSATILSSEGISKDDPVLTEAFAKYAAESKTYADWDTALIRAIADVHKSKARRVADETKTAVEKAREEERAKLRNEQRVTSGAVDKGSPGSAGGKVDFTSMTDEEFRAYDAQRNAERLARTRQLNR